MDTETTWTSDYVRGRRAFLQQMLNNAQNGVDRGDPNWESELQRVVDYVAHETARLDWIVASDLVRES